LVGFNTNYIIRKNIKVFNQKKNLKDNIFVEENEESFGILFFKKATFKIN